MKDTVEMMTLEDFINLKPGDIFEWHHPVLEGQRKVVSPACKVSTGWKIGYTYFDCDVISLAYANSDLPYMSLVSKAKTATDEEIERLKAALEIARGARETAIQKEEESRKYFYRQLDLKTAELNSLRAKYDALCESIAYVSTRLLDSSENTARHRGVISDAVSLWRVRTSGYTEEWEY